MQRLYESASAIGCHKCTTKGGKLNNERSTLLFSPFSSFVSQNREYAHISQWTFKSWEYIHFALFCGNFVTQYRNTVRKNGKYRNTAWKIVQISIPLILITFIIGSAYLWSLPASAFNYLRHSCTRCPCYCVLFCVLYRKESANKRYRNTVNNLISPNTVSQNDEKPHTVR